MNQNPLVLSSERLKVTGLALWKCSIIREVNDELFSGGAALALSLVSSTKAQQNNDAMWTSGNAFLKQCDDSSPLWIAADWSKNDRTIQVIFCQLWIVGMRQGIELTQQVRPKQEPSQEQAARDKQANAQVAANEAHETQYDVIPTGNICIADSVTDEQLRLVIIKWLKDHPSMLTDNGAFLVGSALLSNYQCK